MLCQGGYAMRDVDNHERRARVAILHALHDIVAVIDDIAFYLSSLLSGRFPQPFQDIRENTPPVAPLWATGFQSASTRPLSAAFFMTTRYRFRRGGA